ncbi:MAG: hypothetical protein WCV63_00565 [Negativicutes bacterium]|jgi:spore coat polysaccharide biosynthesis protein SpsF
MKIGGIIFSRMDSVRLPRKAVRKIGATSLLTTVINRAKKIIGLSDLVLATTDRSVDDELIELAEQQGIAVFRGSLENVSKRALDCAKKHGFEYFLRINGDSPFLDYSLVSNSLCLCDGKVDLISNLIKRTYPYGVAVEVIRSVTLEKSINEFSFQKHCEHITKHFYENILNYNIREVSCSEVDLSAIRLVVDDKHDLSIVRKMATLDVEIFCFGNYLEVCELYRKVILKEDTDADTL